MKKIKMFFFAAALTLVTAGVFAGNKKFTTGLFAYNGSGSFIDISSSYMGNLSTSSPGSPNLQATITDYQGNIYSLYGDNTTNIPLYSTSSW